MTTQKKTIINNQVQVNTDKQYRHIDEAVLLRACEARVQLCLND